MSSETLKPTTRTELKRFRERGHFDRDTINHILDASPLCHISYLLDGHPAVVPTLQWREGDRVYWHGSTGSQAIRAATGQQVSLNVTLFDGLVLARSAFHHSANFRSVTIFGEAEAIEDEAAKEQHLRTFLEALYPGRWDKLRAIKPKELRATALLSLPIKEASAKVRTGQPADDEQDYATEVWAGVIPLERVAGTPQADPRNLPGVEEPDYLFSDR